MNAAKIRSLHSVHSSLGKAIHNLGSEASSTTVLDFVKYVAQLNKLAQELIPEGLRELRGQRAELDKAIHELPEALREVAVQALGEGPDG